MVVRCRLVGDKTGLDEAAFAAACGTALDGGFAQTTSVQESLLDPSSVRVTLMVTAPGGAPAVNSKLHQQKIGGFDVEVHGESSGFRDEWLC